MLLSDNAHKNQPVMAGLLVGTAIIVYPLRNSKLMQSSIAEVMWWDWVK